jgi:cell division protein FtsB
VRRLFSRPGGLTAAALFLVIGAAFLTQVVPYRQIVDSRQQVEAAREHLERLTAENRRLETDVAALATDAEIERLAREKLGYVRPGETAYVVVDPPLSAMDPVEAPPADEIEDVRTWVDRIWDFLTGADVADGSGG